MMNVALATLAAQRDSPGGHSPGHSGQISFDIDNDSDKIPHQNEIKLPRPRGKYATSTQVYPWFEITLQSIDVPTQTFTTSIEVHLFWQDYNLPNEFPKYNTDEFSIHEDYLPLKLSEIFENKVSCGNSEPQYKYYESNGVIYMFFIVECTFVERMELHRFPLDRQFLNMEFNGLIKSNIDGEGDWKWILNHPEWMPQELGNQFNKTFGVRMLSSITEYELLSPWADFSKKEPPLVIELRVNRIPNFYFGNIIFPNFLIVGGCFGAFVVPREEVADRLSVTVTLMLAAVAFRFVVSEYLPKVSYLTVMDYYLLIGFVALIVLIFENAVAGSSRLSTANAVMLDNCCFYVFLAIWGTVHIVAMMTAIFKDFLRISWDKMHILDDAVEEEFIYAQKDELYYKQAAVTKKDDNIMIYGLIDDDKDDDDVENDMITKQYSITTLNKKVIERALKYQQTNNIPQIRKRQVSVKNVNKKQSVLKKSSQRKSSKKMKQSMFATNYKVEETKEDDDDDEVDNNKNENDATNLKISVITPNKINYEDEQHTPETGLLSSEIRDDMNKKQHLEEKNKLLNAADDASNVNDESTSIIFSEENE